MRIIVGRSLLLTAIVISALRPALGQSESEPKSSEVKSADAKPAADQADQPVVMETVDSFGRPEGAINDQSARIYVWHDLEGWHIRTTARVMHTFSGEVRVKDAKIMSCVPVGLKHDKKQGAADAWQVNEARDELQFSFTTGKLSDGLDVAVKGDDGQIEFDLKIESHSNPKEIFIGRDRKHPSQTPFFFPANPPIPKAADEKKKA